MKVFGFVLIFLSITYTVFSMELVTELKYQGFDTEKIDFDDEALGRVTLKDNSNENYSFFIEYVFGDGTDRVDAGQIKIMKNNMDFEIGRNRIGWGSGYNLNPTDIFNDIPVGSAYDPTYVKNGRDSIIGTYYTENSSIQGIYAIKDDSEKDEDYGIKYKTSFSEYDLDAVYIHKGNRSAVWGEEEKDDIIGGDISTSIPDLNYGVWIEAAYYLDKRDLVYIIGIDNYFGEKYRVMFEYLYYGLGEDKKGNYNVSRILAGFPEGKSYLMPSITYEYSEKISVTGYCYINTEDSSYLLGTTISYLYTDHIDINLMPFYADGKTGSEYGVLGESFGNIGVSFVMRVVF
ncbi:hypothetical protein [Ilyobacter polytropus]|uniref:Porin domain-containing protein n=1 Tax=Ilyobacter polytropus (strain ATCC 51220 / DSM 2926 / LMG 16218 / CuHBu1) TaxID=572544 RepID=E3H739_ILYPC|nr:hypothetical protein [Ilyobacter polytropus]ADO81935.1 hypothetical protein Ilyop_0146 [Ilyobacter polytropus DSM 2926]